MKLNKLFILALACSFAISCTKDTFEDQSAIDGGDRFGYGQYDDSQYGLYKGLFSTTDGLTRGSLVVTLIPDVEGRAQLTLSTGQVIELTSPAPKVTVDGTINNLRFASQGSLNATFEFSVGNQGETPLVANVVLGDKESEVLVAKNLSRAPLSTITGTYVRTSGTGGFPTSGRTWNIMSIGAGEQTYATQIWYGGRLYNTSNGSQGNCVDNGDNTETCDISGSAIILGHAVTWSGEHTYDSFDDNGGCSGVSGTWESPTYGNSAGTFVSDSSCDDGSVIVNDFCSGALPIAVGETLIGYTYIDPSFTATNGDTPDFCDENLFGSADGIGVWYTFSSENDININVYTNGGNFDTQLRVFSGSCGDLTCVDNDDDSAGSLRSLVNFTALAGETYYFFVGGYNTAAGTFYLSVEEFVEPSCDTTTILCGDSAMGTTTGGTNANAPGTCNTTLNTAAGVWYNFTPDENVSVTVDTHGSSFDTKLGVFTGSCGSFVCVGGNDDTGGMTSQVTFDAMAGTTYYFYVTGYATNNGSYVLNVQCDSLPTAPDNDDCSGAFAIACGGSDTGNTNLATAEDLTSFGCSDNVYGSDNVKGVWYTYTATQDRDVVVSTSGSNYDTHLKVFTGSCGNYTCVVDDDDSGDSPWYTSEVTFSAVTGVTYYIYIGGYNSATGNYVINLTCIDSDRVAAPKRPMFSSEMEKEAYLKQRAIEQQELFAPRKGKEKSPEYILRQQRRK